MAWRSIIRGMRISLSAVSREARGCRFCEKSLPQKPKPIFRAGRTARLLVVGQAPGRRVHQTGIPWNDPSGEVLRAWLAMEREAFYDTARIAIVPVGLCYPGTVDGADLPPCRECAPLWQPRFRAALPEIGLTLLVGSYAQRYWLGAHNKPNIHSRRRCARGASTCPSFSLCRTRAGATRPG